MGPTNPGSVATFQKKFGNIIFWFLCFSQKQPARKSNLLVRIERKISKKINSTLDYIVSYLSKTVPDSFPFSILKLNAHNFIICHNLMHVPHFSFHFCGVMTQLVCIVMLVETVY